MARSKGLPTRPPSLGPAHQRQRAPHQPRLVEQPQGSTEGGGVAQARSGGGAGRPFIHAGEGLRVGRGCAAPGAVETAGLAAGAVPSPPPGFTRSRTSLGSLSPAPAPRLLEGGVAGVGSRRGRAPAARVPRPRPGRAHPAGAVPQGFICSCVGRPLGARAPRPALGAYARGRRERPAGSCVPVCARPAAAALFSFPRLGSQLFTWCPAYFRLLRALGQGRPRRRALGRCTAARGGWPDRRVPACARRLGPRVSALHALDWQPALLARQRGAGARQARPAARPALPSMERAPSLRPLTQAHHLPCAANEPTFPSLHRTRGFSFLGQGSGSATPLGQRASKSPTSHNSYKRSGPRTPRPRAASSRAYESEKGKGSAGVREGRENAASRR